MSEILASVEPVIIEKISMPPVASFWRRFFAWVIDVIILAIIGEVVGYSGLGFWSSLGPYGRIYGFMIVLLYFGVFQSHLGGGQTPGKRMMGISVRSKSGRCVGFKQSFPRIFILSLPAFLFGWSISGSKFIQWAIAAIMVGMGTPILFTMVFNRQTRQGLHDLLVGTYVLYLKGKRVESVTIAGATLMRNAGIVALVMVLLVTAGMLVQNKVSPQSGTTNLNRVISAMQADSEFFGYNLRDGTSRFSTGQTQRVFMVTAQYRGVPAATRYDELFNRVAKNVILNLDQPEQYDLIVISIASVFDLGIARGSTSISDQSSPAEWRTRLNLP